MATQLELKQTLYTSLKELGLTELERDLYTTSLLLGPRPINVLAKELNISRPNVYKVIAGREKKGLARFSDRQKYARAFMVESPTKVLEMARAHKDALLQKTQELSSALPELLTLYHQGEGPTKVSILQGDEQVQKTFQMIMDEAKDEMEFFGSAKDFVTYVSGPGQKNMVKWRLKNNIKVRALLLESDEAFDLKVRDKDELRETRFLKNTDSFSVSFQLFGNKIIMWQPKTPLALVVEDEYIVEMFRAVFESLWKQNKE